MPDPSDSPEWASVIRSAIDARLVDVHTSIPGRIEAYDPATQTADVRPQFKRVMRRADGTRVAEDLPVIPCVPVQWPRGGGFAMTMPLRPGDFGTIILNEYSIDRWRSQGQQVDPADERRHGLSGAIFVPGVFPSSAALVDASNFDEEPAEGARLGKDGGYFIEVTDGQTRLPNDASEFLARADRVLSEVQSFATKYDAHTHLETGATTDPPLPAARVGTVGSVASDTVKAK